MNFKKTILIIGPVFSRSGYGDHARDIVDAILELNNYNVLILATRWGHTPELLNEYSKYIEYIIKPESVVNQPDIMLQFGLPSEFTPNAKYNIGITAGVETTLAPANFIDGCNRMDLVIVPSNFTKLVLENTKYDKIEKTTGKVEVIEIKTPIKVLFEGLNIDKFSSSNVCSKFQTDLNKLIKEDFAFLFVGHWLPGDIYHDRKDVGGLIKTFIATFVNKFSKNQPALILKTNRVNYSESNLIAIKKDIQRIKDIYFPNVSKSKFPAIYLIHGTLSDKEMNTLYRYKKVKAHISFTKGEGFGRPLLEASYTGKPVIAPIATGQADFLNRSYCFDLPGSLKQIHPTAVMPNILLPESKWLYVNYDYASKVMNTVFENYDECLKGSKPQILHVEQNFSKEKMVIELSNILNGIFNNSDFKNEQFVNLTMPDMSKIKRII